MPTFVGVLAERNLLALTALFGLVGFDSKATANLAQRMIVARTSNLHLRHGRLTLLQSRMQRQAKKRGPRSQRRSRRSSVLRFGLLM